MSDMVNIAIEFSIYTIALIILLIGLFQVLIYTIQIFIATYSLWKHPKGNYNIILDKFSSNIAPPISIIIAAYNEEMNITESIHSMLRINYPKFDIIIVNDGSTDNTLKIIMQHFELYEIVVDRPQMSENNFTAAPIRAMYASKLDPRIRVIDKAFNSGKADSLNTGIAYSTSPLFSTIDADSILDKNAILRAVRPFIEEPSKTVATGGTIRVVNGCQVIDGQIKQISLPKNFLACFQVIEYLRAFFMGRVAWGEIDTVMLISGAFGVFRRKDIMNVGGYQVGSMGEDFDLIVKVHAYMIDHDIEYKITFVPDAVCWTEVPEKLAVLSRQRIRWQVGALEVIKKNAGIMMLRRRYGRIGFVGMSYTVAIDIIWPIGELIGYILFPVFCMMGFISLRYLLVFFSFPFTFGILMSAIAIAFEVVLLKQFFSISQVLGLFCASILENFGYRQLCSWWRLRGIWRFMRGNTKWGQMERTGINKKALSED